CSRVSTPLIRWRVVCALRETMDSLAPIRAFAKVDLPTLGRPTIATYPQRKGVLICVPGSKRRASSAACAVCGDAAPVHGLRRQPAVQGRAGRRTVRPHGGSNLLLPRESLSAAPRMPLQTVDY